MPGQLHDSGGRHLHVIAQLVCLKSENSPGLLHPRIVGDQHTIEAQEETSVYCGPGAMRNFHPATRLCIENFNLRYRRKPPKSGFPMSGLDIAVRHLFPGALLVLKNWLGFVLLKHQFFSI